MKVRSDFVTNSSSSSFIIGKGADDSYTIESVYQIIRGFYKELLTKRDEVRQYLKERPEIKVEYKYDPEYEGSIFVDKNVPKEQRWRIMNNIDEMLGFDSYQAFTSEDEWVQCETYKDYLKYWKKNKHKSWTQPFTIEDFSAPYFDEDSKWNHFEVLSWYDVKGSDDSFDWNKEKKTKKLLSLGRICIHSYCGLIHNYVVEKLGEISRHWCDHMG